MILFLDFDGVLHPDAALLVNGRPTLKADGELMMWAPAGRLCRGANRVEYELGA